MIGKEDFSMVIKVAVYFTSSNPEDNDLGHRCQIYILWRIMTFLAFVELGWARPAHLAHGLPVWHPWLRRKYTTQAPLHTVYIYYTSLWSLSNYFYFCIFFSTSSNEISINTVMEVLELICTCTLFIHLVDVLFHDWFILHLKFILIRYLTVTYLEWNWIQTDSEMFGTG